MVEQTKDLVIIGGGVVGAALLFTLAHRGIDPILIEAEPDLAYAASGTNSGVLHTGFDSTPGDLETRLIVRSAQIRLAVLEVLGVPVLRCGARLTPRDDAERATVAALAENAARNGVDVEVRDGALIVPGESVTDPVAYTLALVASAVAAGASVRTGSRVTAIEQGENDLVAVLASGDRVRARTIVNCAGLHADDVARLVGDDSFSIYPRKGEFFVFDLPGGLEHIVLPVPTKRTKGVLVFPTLDGRVIAGPTAVDLEDKTDWNVRPEAEAEVLPKAIANVPALEGLQPVARYAGLRPAGREVNYVIAPSAVCPRLINVAAIRSTGLSASLGIAEHVTELVAATGIKLGPGRAPTRGSVPATAAGPWWGRTASYRG